MGLTFSEQGPGRFASNSLLQYQLINYLTRTLYIRNLVSKQRRRMLVGGYDLDMSFITGRLLAMSFPAERMQAIFRNPLWQVKDVLDMRHNGHYKVYNLRVEESYDPLHFHGRVETFPFDDHHIPPLQTIKLFCKNVHSWLSSHPKNIAVVHCMAGKGRTGLTVCAYLVYTGMSAEEALKLHADKRTTNNEGVTGQLYRPSLEVARSCCRQIKKGYQRTNSPRYYLSFGNNDQQGTKSEQGERCVVVQMDTESPVLYQKACLDYNFDKPLKVTGDVHIIFYQKSMGGRLFYTCFNTAFIRNSLLQVLFHSGFPASNHLKLN
ncbi:hypothetical protein VitviT2T_022697 [Vitis vinifera]|uniref:Phosphatidylinositol 3,4,5-trisphosphate 3-phosphatase and protein-tyrosine-phosphatase PTEN1 n=1 Tax=Vitis vinifera TaxID=29760 RepID=A0ABY9DC12_VITVI|nr:hypothetical protein VitviT2T_022697 [Vitis vinifera]